MEKSADPDDSGQKSSHFSRRDFLKLAAASTAASATATALSACRTSPTPQRGTKVQLVYQDWRTDWFPGMAREMLAEFNAAHPNIRVFYAIDPPSDIFNDKMIADFQSGTARSMLPAMHFISLPVRIKRLLSPALLRSAGSGK